MFWKNYLYFCTLTGESPNALAARIGVKSSGTVTGWSDGAKPRKKILYKLAQEFGFTEEEMLTEDLAKKEKPANLSVSELNEQLSTLLKSLNTEEEAQVCAFVKGLLTNRAKKPSLDK